MADLFGAVSYGNTAVAALERYANPHGLKKLGRSRLTKLLIRASRGHGREDKADEILAAADETLGLWLSGGLDFDELADDIAIEVRLSGGPFGHCSAPGNVMRNRLAGDLGRWENGELSLVEIESRHPGDDVGSLVGVHARMATHTGQLVPEPEAAWAALSAVLAAHPQAATRRRPPSRRRVVAAIVAAMVAVPAVSYAAAPDAVRTIARQVTDLMPGADDADPVAPDDDGPSTSSTIPAKGDSSGPGEVGKDMGTDADGEQDGEDPDDGRDDGRAGDVEESEERFAPTADEDPTESPEERAEPQAPDRDDD